MTTNRSSEELQMRALIVPRLRTMYPSARIIHELPVRYSTNRIDLAAVTPREIVSVEIKSSKDVADRLEAQLRAFLPVSSLLWVALAPKWNEKLPMTETRNEARGYTSYTLQFTPAQEAIRRVRQYGIGVWTVDANSGLVKETDAALPVHPQPWTAAMLDMLHVAELCEVAARHRICLGRRPNHKQCVEACVEVLTGREIIAAVCAAIRARDAFDKASDPPIANARVAA